MTLNAFFVWARRLSAVALSMPVELATPELGRLRIDAIQGFNGLEADVVIVVGVGRQAKVLLYIFALEGVGLGLGMPLLHSLPLG